MRERELDVAVEDLEGERSGVVMHDSFAKARDLIPALSHLLISPAPASHRVSMLLQPVIQLEQSPLYPVGKIQPMQGKASQNLDSWTKLEAALDVH
jgi:hypothetical protein